MKSQQKRRPDESLSQRGVLPPTLPFGSELMLDIEQVDTDRQFQDWAAALWPQYRLSALAVHRFFAASTNKEKCVIVAELAERTDIHPDVAKGLSQLCHSDAETVLMKAASVCSDLCRT